MQLADRPTLDISEARRNLNKLDEKVQSQRVLYVTRHGKEAFAVVDIEFLDAVLETIDILSDPEATALLAASVKAIQEGQLIDHEEIRRKYL